MSQLTLNNLSVTYGSHLAVNKVSWSKKPGVHALLGPNGAGKSTLLATLATLLKPSSGTISIDEHRSKTELRKRIGYLPQDNIGKSRFSVKEHLAYLCWLKKISQKDTKLEIERVLDLVDLNSQANLPISHLSGGMRRRVGIGSAIIGNPKVLLLDEPSAGLDVEQRSNLRSIIRHISNDTVVISSTHIVEDILEDSQSITVMNRGSFLFDGARQSFTSSSNLFDFEQRYLEVLQS